MVNGGGWTVGVGRLSLRGDVLVRAYRRPASSGTTAATHRQLVFACQFHTCAVADHTLSFTKQQLDHAAHGMLSSLIHAALYNYARLHEPLLFYQVFVLKASIYQSINIQYIRVSYNYLKI